MSRRSAPRSQKSSSIIKADAGTGNIFSGKNAPPHLSDLFALPMNRTSSIAYRGLGSSAGGSARVSGDATLRLHAAAQMVEEGSVDGNGESSDDDDDEADSVQTSENKHDEEADAASQEEPTSRVEKIKQKHAQDNDMKQVLAWARENEGSLASVMPVAQVFCLLDEMFRKGKLSYSRVAILKGKYQLLMDTLRRKRDHYNRVFGNIRRQNEEISTFKKDVKRAERLPESSRVECDRHRRDLQRIHDNLKESKEREDQLEAEIAELHEELLKVGKEKEKVPEPDVVTKRIKDLSNDRDVLRAEIIVLRQKKQLVAHRLEEQLDEIQQVQLHYEKEKKHVSETHTTLEALNSRPAMLEQENEKERNMHHHLTQSLGATTGIYNELAKQLDINNRDTSRLYEQKRKCEEQGRKRSKLLQQKQEMYDSIFRELQKAREEEAYLAQESHQIERDRGDTEVQLHIAADALRRRIKERDIDFRFLRSLEKHLRYAGDSLKSTRLHFSNASASVKEWRANLADQRDTALQANKTSEAAKKRTRMDAEHLSGIEVMMKKLRREMQRIGDMREHAKQRWTQASETWTETELDLQTVRVKLRNAEVLRQRYYDLNRRRKIDQRETKIETEHLQRILSHFLTNYHKLERERAEMSTQLGSKRAKVETMQEKNSLYKGELDVLRIKTQDKEKELVGERIRFISLMFERDACRMDLLKQRNEAGDLRRKLEQKRAASERSRKQIEIICARCEDLHGTIERMMRSRNDTALKIHAIQSEACIVTERVVCLSTLNEKGHLAAMQLSQTISVYRRAATELRTTVQQLIRLFPESKIMALELATTKMQTIEAVDANICTELALERSTHNRETIRFLPGADPNMKQLELKCRQLERKLFEKDIGSIKCELQLEHLERVLQLAEREQSELKQAQLDPAVTVMHLRKRLERLVKRERMLLIDVELAQTSAKRSEEQNDNVESFVLHIKRNLQEGETSDMPETFIRLLQLDRRRTQVKKKSRRQNNRNWHPVTYGTAAGSGADGAAATTTVLQQITAKGLTRQNNSERNDFSLRKPIEIRPNCYYPKIGERIVLIPVPYSRYAPFKPYSRNFQISRHYRKPKRKLIAPLVTNQLAMTKSEDAWLNVLDWLHAKSGANTNDTSVSPQHQLQTNNIAPATVAHEQQAENNEANNPRNNVGSLAHSTRTSATVEYASSDAKVLVQRTSVTTVEDASVIGFENVPASKEESYSENVDTQRQRNSDNINRSSAEQTTNPSSTSLPVAHVDDNLTGGSAVEFSSNANDEYSTSGGDDGTLSTLTTDAESDANADNEML